VRETPWRGVGTGAYRRDVSHAFRGRCPRCGERALVEILYGTPDDPALRSLWLEGKAMIREGSCGDGPPGWMCWECGYEEREYRATLRPAG
jgi:hypothetical protein